jgi:hypothetical protein
VPQPSCEIPVSIRVGELALNGITDIPTAKPPSVDAVTGNSYSVQAFRDRVECLARALARDYTTITDEIYIDCLILSFSNFNYTDHRQCEAMRMSRLDCIGG